MHPETKVKLNNTYLERGDSGMSKTRNTCTLNATEYLSILYAQNEQK